MFRNAFTNAWAMSSSEDGVVFGLVAWSKVSKMNLASFPLHSVPLILQASPFQHNTEAVRGSSRGCSTTESPRNDNTLALKLKKVFGSEASFAV